LHVSSLPLPPSATPLIGCALVSFYLVGDVVTV